MPVSLHSFARREVNRTAESYDEDRAGLGDEFLAEFEKALDIVEAQGAARAIWQRDIRVVRLNRFPYQPVELSRSSTNLNRVTRQ